MIDFFSTEMIECRDIHFSIYGMMFSLLIILGVEFMVIIGLYAHVIKRLVNTAQSDSEFKHQGQNNSPKTHYCAYIVLFIFAFLILLGILVSYPIAAIILSYRDSPDDSNLGSNLTDTVYNPCDLTGISMTVQTVLKAFGYTALVQRFFWLLSLILGFGCEMCLPGDAGRGVTLKSAATTGGMVSMVILMLFFVPMVTFWGYAVAMLTNTEMDVCSAEYPDLKKMLFSMVIIQAMEFVPLVLWLFYIVKKTFF